MKRLLVLCMSLPSLAWAGGSGWSHFVPYEADTAAVLQKLRWQVFRKGKYYKLDPKRKAKSPEHALELNDTEETHSIIDIQKVAAAPSESCGMMTVCPLKPATLVELLGSERPARAKVEAADSRLQSLLQRWSGVWIVVYEGDSPEWIYFGGHSGD